MLCGSLPALWPLLVSVMPKLYSNVCGKTSRGVCSARPSIVRQSVELISTEAGQPMSDIPSASPPVEGKAMALGDDQIRVTTTVELRWGTWFKEEDGSLHNAEYVEQRQDPQQPPPIYLRD